MRLVYQHTQIGYVNIIIVLMIFAIYVMILISKADETPISLTSTRVFVPVSLLVVCGVLFSSLTITVDRNSLAWRFGPGPIRMSEALANITNAKVSDVSMSEGLGIRQTSSGWLYNVGPGQVVQIVLRDGREIQLGTDDPTALVSAIQAAGARVEARRIIGK